MLPGHVLERLVPAIPTLLGGSADLTPANNTQTEGRTGIDVQSFEGGYIHYGAREHGMAAVMNGIALHKGLIPFAGTFLAFTDYARPAIRLGALMQQQVIHVMTHDSVCLGEDGPTHQPIEHLASLRAMPGLLTFRPADAVEVGECWELAIGYRDGPSVIALSRHPVALVRHEANDSNLCARGAYILAEASGEPVVSIAATGAEVGLALEARRQLEAEGIGTRVISMPCVELFEMQDPAWQQEILGEATNANGRRSCSAAGMGPLYRARRQFHRHVRLWRFRTGRSAVRTIWHHTGGHSVRGPQTPERTCGLIVGVVWSADARA